MHEAFSAIPILERLPLEIESLTAYDGNLVVGTKQGHLLMYSVGESGAQADVQLLRSNKNFSRKPITQVAVVPHHQILISLSDSVVSIHDLTVYNFPLLSTMANTKGATTFDLEVKQHLSLTGETAVTVRLAVAVRRRVQLYYWKARQFQSLQADLTLTDAPQQLLWCGGALVVDQLVGYRTVQLSGGQTAPVEYGRGCEPRLVPAGGKGGVALQLGNTSIAVQDGAAGIIGPPCLLAWTNTPSATVYQSPFVVGVVGRQVEIVSADETLLLQTLPLNKPRLLAPDVATTNRSGPCRVFCASLSHVWCLTGVPASVQIPDLLTRDHYSLALRLLDAWGDNTSEEAVSSSRQHIHKLHAFHLFCNSQYERALKIFQEIDTELLFVVGLFPALVPEDCQRRLQYPATPPPLSKPNLETALGHLIDYLLVKRRSLVNDLEKSGRKSGNNSRESTPKKGSSTSGRRKGVLHHQLQVVDTTLLKCYLQVRPTLVGPLLRLNDGRVSLAEGERLLREHDRLPDFLLLLRARGQHQRALTLLRQHQHTTQPSPLQGPNATVEYLQNLGPEQLDLVLQHGQWLVAEHPLAALRVFTGVGAAITDAEALPRYRIVDYLKQHQSRLAMLYLEHLIHEWGDVSSAIHNELIRQYRDYIVEETNRRLLPKLASLQTNESSSPFSRQDDETGRLNDDKMNCSLPLDRNIVTSDSTNNVDYSLPADTIQASNVTTLSDNRLTNDIDSGKSSQGKAATPKTYHPDLMLNLSEVRTKLLDFLTSSKNYTPATVLYFLDEQECLLPARAVVLGALGQHRQALKIYVAALHDLPAALHYCHQHYASTGPASQVYLLLMELLIQCEDVASLLTPRPRDVPLSPSLDTNVLLTQTLLSSKHSIALSNTSPSSSRAASPSSGTPSPTKHAANNNRPSKQITSKMGSRVPSDDSPNVSFVTKNSDSSITSGDSSSRRHGSDLTSSDQEEVRTRNVGVSNNTSPVKADRRRHDGDGAAGGGVDSGRSSRASGNSQTSSVADMAKTEMLLKLLHTYAPYIRLKPAVQMLPDGLSVCELRGFLQSWVREFATTRRKTVLQHGVAQAVASQVTSDLCSAQGNKLNMSTEKTCCICKKRFTRYGAFVCSPSGAVCHFSCRERLQSSWLQAVKEAEGKQALLERTRAAVAAATGGGGNN